MLNKDGKLFGVVNIIDFIVLMMIIIGLIGIAYVKFGGHKTSDTVSLKESPVEFEIFSRGQKFKHPDNLFKDQKYTFLTIRNVPYTKVEILNYQCNPWKLAVPNPATNTAVAIDDPSAPMTWDCAFKVRDKAVLTEDGPTLGGNKIKVGLKIEFEGFNYRLGGIVTDVKVLDGDK